MFTEPCFKAFGRRLQAICARGNGFELLSQRKSIAFIQHAVQAEEHVEHSKRSALVAVKKSLCLRHTDSKERGLSNQVGLFVVCGHPRTLQRGVEQWLAP